MYQTFFFFFCFCFPCRCSHVQGDAKEVAPVIDQFLEVVWQLMEQFPCAFEYNERFLISLHHHIYACQYGNFICNSQKERRDERWNTLHTLLTVGDGVLSERISPELSIYFHNCSVFCVCRIQEKTHSIWPYLWENKSEFMNPFFRPNHSQSQGVLWPNTAPYCFKYVQACSSFG